MKRVLMLGTALAWLPAATSAMADRKNDTLRWTSRQTISSADPYFNEFR